MPDQQDLETAIRYYREGAFGASARACQELLRHDKENVRALNLLGVLHSQAGRLADAEACYRKALQADPSNIKALCNLGASLITRGAAAEAIPYLRGAVRIDPDDAEAHNGLGFALFTVGDSDGALGHLRDAVRLDPRHVGAQVNFGKVLLAHDRFVDAESCFRTALRVMPDDVRTSISLSDVLVRQHRFEEALAVLDRIQTVDPDCEPAIVAKTKILMWTGRYDDAAAIVDRFVQAAAALPSEIVRAYGALAAVNDDRARAVDYLERRLAQSGEDKAHRRTLHFVLGALYDGLNAFDDAFRHFAAGNAVRLDLTAPVAVDTAIDRIAAFFTRARLAELPRAANDSKLPVFIVGMPRSGKSLVEYLLAGHPDVFPGSELMGILRMATSLGAHFDGQVEAASTPAFEQASLDAASENYRKTLTEIGGAATRVTSTLPYNFKHLGLISLLFPGARVIHCVRDPVDTGLACYFKEFTVGYGFDDLRDIGAYRRQYDGLMRHWRAVLDIPIQELRYEDLVTNPNRTRHELIDFLGLKAVADHAISPIVTRDQIRLPIRPAGIGRWRRYERYLGPLLDALGLQR